MGAKRLFLHAAAILLITGCGSSSLDDDCSSKIDDLHDDHGSPEEIITYRSGDWHGETHWYYRRGFARTFTWEDGTYGSCDVSDTTFNPI
jgi:hypothetical protein